MAQKIKIEQLADTITQALKEYTKEVEEGVEKAVDETAKECAKELQQTSPRRKGEYAKGWGVQKEGSKRIVWNKKRYMLVHLLEKGHAKRGGGRVAGKPHVAPAEQKYIKVLEDRVERVIKQGG